MSLLVFITRLVLNMGSKYYHFGKGIVRVFWGFWGGGWRGVVVEKNTEYSLDTGSW